jgi:hypothetical protein
MVEEGGRALAPAYHKLLAELRHARHLGGEWGLWVGAGDLGFVLRFTVWVQGFGLGLGYRVWV